MVSINQIIQKSRDDFKEAVQDAIAGDDIEERLTLCENRLTTIENYLEYVDGMLQELGGGLPGYNFHAYPQPDPDI